MLTSRVSRQSDHRQHRMSESEQRHIAGNFLRGLIEIAPDKKLRLGLVLVEDCYERSFGDGTTIYLQRAFWSLGAARRCVEWIERNRSPNRSWLGLTARDVEAFTDGPHHWHYHPLDGEELNIYLGGSSDLERALIGDASDWRRSLSYCLGREAEEPDFGDASPDGWTALGLTLKS